MWKIVTYDVNTKKTFKLSRYLVVSTINFINTEFKKKLSSLRFLKPRTKNNKIQRKWCDYLGTCYVLFVPTLKTFRFSVQKLWNDVFVFQFVFLKQSLIILLFVLNENQSINHIAEFVFLIIIGKLNKYIL